MGRGYATDFILRRISDDSLNDKFINFYVFDGELAQHLLDREYTDAQVVVENLFQINTFDNMARKVREYWEHKYSECRCHRRTRFVP